MYHKQRIKKTNSFSSTATIIGLFVVFLFVVFLVYDNSSKQENIETQVQVLDKEIEDLKNQNLELTDLIDYFSSSEYVEKEAREKLNLVKPGEKVVVVTKSDKINNENEKEFELINSKNSPAKWWRYFFGK